MEARCGGQNSARPDDPQPSQARHLLEATAATEAIQVCAVALIDLRLQLEHLDGGSLFMVALVLWLGLRIERQT